jgi:pimeloyl-ACP methyl ester carboxylesterase
VVFVYGDISDLRMWRRQLHAFAAEYRAVAYSRRYARPNAEIEPCRADPISDHGADLQELLHALDLAPAHLVGNSLGALTCLLVAARRPALVRSLVLQEPPAVELFLAAPPTPPALLRLFAHRPRAALAIMRFGLGAMSPAAHALADGELEKALARFCTAILSAEGEAHLPELRRQQMRENARTFQAHLIGALPPTAGEAATIRAPTLLITGQRSHPALRLITAELERLLPNSQRAEIAAAAHFANEDNPAAYNRAVLDFLNAQPATTLLPDRPVERVGSDQRQEPIVD